MEIDSFINIIYIYVRWKTLQVSQKKDNTVSDEHSCIVIYIENN